MMDLFGWWHAFIAWICMPDKRAHDEWAAFQDRGEKGPKP